jgi:presenilin-like A22 family membrane protease
MIDLSIPEVDLHIGEHPVARIEYSALVEAGVMLLVQIMALGLVLQIEANTGGTSGAASGVPEPPSAGGENLVGLVGLWVVEFLVLAALWKLYQRLPEYWQYRARQAVGVLLLAAFTLYLYSVDPRSLVLFVPGLAVYYLFNRFDLYWLINNMAAVGLAILGAVALGFLVPPLWLAGGLVAFVLWDFVAVDLSSIMGGIVDASAEFYVPNFFVVPATLQIDWDRLRSALSGDLDESPDDVAGIIGVGDFVMPSAFVVSVEVASAQTLGLPVLLAGVGSVAGLFVLQSFLNTRDSGMPALPVLVPCVFAGWLVGTALDILGGGV